eukprot:IDg21268t1
MKRLCAGEWKCVRTSKLVNNLKISANTRAIVSEDIVVTPYDLRFPLWATWVVQIAEDALNIVGASVVVGGIAALALVFSVRMGKRGLKDSAFVLLTIEHFSSRTRVDVF